MSRNRPSFSAVPVAEDLAGLTRAVGLTPFSLSSSNARDGFSAVSALIIYAVRAQTNSFVFSQGYVVFQRPCKHLHQVHRAV